jgi:hypothetical protein
VLLDPNAIGLFNNNVEIRDAINATGEFTIELYFKASNIGDFYAPVLTTCATAEDN